MKFRAVELFDSSGRLVAVAKVHDEGHYFGGSIDLTGTPERFRTLFDEFEKTINDQMLGLVEDVQAKIHSLDIKAVFDGNFEARAVDLQVFPSTGEVTFRIALLPTKTS
jgi:hypothetical protein